MSETGHEAFLNPITLEAHFFLQTIEKYGEKYEFVDDELLTTMDKLVDAINNFYDKSTKKLHETGEMKLVKVKETDHIVRVYSCTRCHENLGSAEKTTQHMCKDHNLNETEVQPKFERKKRKQKNKENVTIKLSKKARLLFSGKISRLTKRLCLTASTLKKTSGYDVIEKDLMEVLQQLFPDKTLKMYKFGSRISGIGNVDSDLDIFVEIDGSFHDYSYKASQQTTNQVNRLAKILKNNKKWSKVIAILSARVPIIRLKHNSTKINCDIGLSNSMGYCNTLLMEYFFELQPIAVRMCVFLKEWLDRLKVPDYISTYGFVLMVIFYLQMYYALPSVEDLQEDLEKPEFIGPWVCNFRRKSLKELNLELIEVTKANIREHIHNFFIFYGEFNYEKFVICPYIGELAKLDELSERLPDRYKKFIKNNEIQVEKVLKKPIFVQDPMELNNNVTKGISKSLLKVFVDYFMDSAKIISNNENAEEIDENQTNSDG